jgi:hypothetical protein
MLPHRVPRTQFQAEKLVEAFQWRDLEPPRRWCHGEDGCLETCADPQQCSMTARVVWQCHSESTPTGVIASHTFHAFKPGMTGKLGEPQNQSAIKIVIPDTQHGSKEGGHLAVENQKRGYWARHAPSGQVGSISRLETRILHCPIRVRIPNPCQMQGYECLPVRPRPSSP